MSLFSSKLALYVSVWLIAVLFLSLLLVVAENSRTALDDADPAQQRPGILLLSEQIDTDIKLSDNEPTVVLFAQTLNNEEAFHDLSKTATITERSNLVIVTQDGSRPLVTSGIDTFYSDINRMIANQLQMPEPKGGGYPIGYTVINSKGILRYATLDPGWQHRPNEMITVLGAVE